MRKNIVMSIVIVAIVLLTVSAWLVNNQFSSFQAQIADLQTRNSKLESQNSDLQNQTSSLERQNSELVNQLGDLTKQLALERSLRIEIVSLSHRDYWGAYGGLLVYYPFNVTVRNNDVVAVGGLTLTVKTLSGSQEIGWAYSTNISTLRAREERQVQGEAVVPLDASSDLTYVATLKSGDVVLDEFRLP